MAVTFSNLTGGTATATSTITTGSITPPSNELILLSIDIYDTGRSTPIPTPTVTGNSLTWVLVAGTNYDNTSTDYSTTFLFRAMGASPSSGTVQIDFAGDVMSEASYQIDSVNGVDTGGTNGSKAVAQINSIQVASGGSGTVTLDTFVASGNACFAVFSGQKSGTLTFTVGSGFTQLGSTRQPASGISWLATEYQVADVDASATWSATTIFKSGAIAIEVAAPGQTSSFPQVIAGPIVAQAAGTTVTAELPPHKNGDILLVFAMDNVGATITTPSGGWATIVASQNDANESSAWFWLRASGPNTTNPVVTFSTTASTTAGHYATAAVVSDAIGTGTPYEDETVNGSPTLSTTPTSATITTTGANRTVAVIGLLDDDNTISSGWPPSGYTRSGEPSSTTGGDSRTLIGKKFQAAAGDAAGGVIATMSASDYWRVLHLAFLPVIPPGGMTYPRKALSGAAYNSMMAR